MKKYFFEADRKQWEKPTEPKYVFCPPVSVIVCAESETEALELADQTLTEEFFGTGALVGTPRLVKSVDLPSDWNYGYGEDRGTGSAEDRAVLLRNNLGSL